MSPKASWSGTTAGAGISHMHAQFGGMPAAVAMYAAEVATRVDGRDDVTWSYTVHGYHDFTNEREIRLDLEDCFGVDGRVHLGLHRIAGHAAGVTGGLAQGPRRAMRHRPRPLSDVFPGRSVNDLSC